MVWLQVWAVHTFPGIAEFSFCRVGRLWVAADYQRLHLQSSEAERGNLALNGADFPLMLEGALDPDPVKRALISRKQCGQSAESSPMIIVVLGVGRSARRGALAGVRRKMCETAWRQYLVILEKPRLGIS